MWNETAPSELLKEMPMVINDGNLERIQSLIDYDKFINSAECGYDLCGSYAPFCKGCDKTRYCPCAYSYIKMKQAEGLKVYIDKVDEVPADVDTQATVKSGIKIATARRKKA